MWVETAASVFVETELRHGTRRTPPLAGCLRSSRAHTRCLCGIRRRSCWQTCSEAP
jgi:hypothetical protein